MRRSATRCACASAPRRSSRKKGFWTSRVQSDGSPGSRDIGERNIVMGRAQLAIEPNESLDILLKVDAQHSDFRDGPARTFRHLLRARLHAHRPRELHGRVPLFGHRRRSVHGRLGGRFPLRQLIELQIQPLYF